mgnify:CR=1 FL=1
MPRLPRVLLLALLFASPLPLLASSFAATSAGSASDASSDGSSASSHSSAGDDKLVLAAREDAAGFVASAGALRNARLEAAFAQLREHDARLAEFDDLALARWILAR